MKVEAILADKGRDVVTVSDSDTVTDVVNVLVAKRIGAVVVSDGGGGVAGIITERDVGMPPP